MSQSNPQPNKYFWFLVIWCASLGLQFPFILSFLFLNPLDQLDYKILLFQAASAFIWLLYRPPPEHFLNSRVQHWSRIFMFMAACLPVFGNLLILAIYFSLVDGKSMSSVTADEEDIFLPRPLWQSPERSTNKQQRIMAELDFQPLSDVMAGNDEELKRGAIEKLAQIRTPDAISTLLIHRSDASPEIRFYITSALARVKNDYDEQLEAAKIQMQKDVYKISARFFLAKCYLEYVASQLLDEATDVSYTKEARYHLEYCMESEHDSPEMGLVLAKLYADTKEWQKAQELLDNITRNAPEESIEAGKLITQIHFRQGHYADVVSQLGILADKGNLSPEWNAVIDWWEAAPSLR